MFSFACKVSEEVLFPQFAVKTAKKVKSVVDKFDGGLLDKTTSKFDEWTEDYVEPVEGQYTVLISKRDASIDSAYELADSHLKPLEGETKCGSATGKIFYLPFLVLLRLKAQSMDYASAKYSSVKSQVVEVGTPYYTQATTTFTDWAAYGKEQVVGLYNHESIKSTITYITDLYTRVKKEHFQPLYAAVSEKFTELSTSDYAKDAQKIALDTKVKIVNSTAYAKSMDAVNYVAGTYPVSAAIEYSNEIYKNGLKYFSFQSTNPSA